jgi:hypothetical protein
MVATCAPRCTGFILIEHSLDFYVADGCERSAPGPLPQVEARFCFLWPISGLHSHDRVHLTALSCLAPDDAAVLVIRFRPAGCVCTAVL